MNINYQKAVDLFEQADRESGEIWDVMLGIGYALLAVADAAAIDVEENNAD